MTKQCSHLFKQVKSNILRMAVNKWHFKQKQTDDLHCMYYKYSPRLPVITPMKYFLNIRYPYHENRSLTPTICLEQQTYQLLSSIKDLVSCLFCVLCTTEEDSWIAVEIFGVRNILLVWVNDSRGMVNTLNNTHLYKYRLSHKWKTLEVLDTWNNESIFYLAQKQHFLVACDALCYAKTEYI